MTAINPALSTVDNCPAVKGMGFCKFPQGQSLCCSTCNTCVDSPESLVKANTATIAGGIGCDKIKLWGMCTAAKLYEALCCASCGPHPSPPPPYAGTSIPLYMNNAIGASTIAIGSGATAIEPTAMAFGVNVVAESSASIAMGVETRTKVDKTGPTGHSAGGAVAMGGLSVAMGDYSTAMNMNTNAKGYCSTAMGEGTTSLAFGELAAGLYTETEEDGHPYTPSYPVVPSSPNASVYPWPEDQYGGKIAAQIPVNYSDAVLRIGIGYCEEYSTTPSSPYWACKKAKRMDGMRLHRDGRLYLRKVDGSSMYDVQAAIEALQAASAGRRLAESELKVTKDELKLTRDALKDTQDALAALTARVAKLEK